MDNKRLNSEHFMVTSIINEPVGTGMLAFRDLKNLFAKYITGKNALDFGCGTGRSSRFLKNCGFDVTGIDICEKFLNEARQRDSDSKYLLLNNALNTIISGRYDLIFISFVLQEISNQYEISDILNRLKVFLSDNGKIVVVTTSDQFYNRNWLSIKTDYKENKTAKTGDIVKVYLEDYGLEIRDYFWKESDCEKLFNISNLGIIEKIAPLGQEYERKWIDELYYPPFVVYVLKNPTHKV